MKLLLDKEFQKLLLEYPRPPKRFFRAEENQDTVTAEWMIRDGNGNDLKVGPAGLSNGGTYAAMTDFESSATKKSLTVSGHKVYALYMNVREGYRTPLNVKAKNVPMGNTPQGIYELADGTHAVPHAAGTLAASHPIPRNTSP